jgi:prepilin-type N-terminal cleavage/methylation domain-containing protein
MCAHKISPRQQGFSLIELLIVLAIIATLAAIALPNFFESRQAAYNGSALGSLRVIHTAQASYRAANPQYGTLAQLSTSGYLSDPLLVTGQRSNYTFTVNAATLSNSFYEVNAAPSIAPWRFFYMDVSGVIRTKVGGPADSSSAPINY